MNPPFCFYFIHAKSSSLKFINYLKTLEMATMVQVAEREGGQIFLFPIEEDGTILSLRIHNYFRCLGWLRYRSQDTNTVQGLRYVDGKFYPPDGGWKSVVCFLDEPHRFNHGHVHLKRNIDSPLETLVPYKMMRTDTKPIDLIILGLKQDTKDQHLRQRFSQYGDLSLATIKRDSNGVSKGFGFIRFNDYDSQKAVLSAVSPFHFVNGHWCELKVPNSKVNNTVQYADGSKYFKNMIFVGCCYPDIVPTDLRQYFSRFGEVSHAYVPRNKDKDYAFVTFKKHEIAQSLWGEDHTIKGHSVIIRPVKIADSFQKLTKQPISKHVKISSGKSTVPNRATSNVSSPRLLETSPEIQNAELSCEVLEQITDILAAEQICKHHPPVYYTNMLYKKLALARLVKILRNEGRCNQS